MTKDLVDMIQAMKRLEIKHGHFRLDIGFGLLLSLVAQLQLALRHPGNRGHAAKEARRFLDGILARIGAEEPGLRKLLEKGFDRGQDVSGS